MSNETKSETPYNPWREFVEDVISGANYFKIGEYHELLEYIDALLGKLATVTRELGEADAALVDAEKALKEALRQHDADQSAMVTITRERNEARAKLDGHCACLFDDEDNAVSICAEHKEWRDERDALRAEVERLRSELAGARMEIDIRKTHSVALKEAEDRIRSLELDVAEKERPLDAQMARLNLNLVEANTRAVIACSEADALKTQVEKLRGELAVVTRERNEARELVHTMAGVCASDAGDNKPRGPIEWAEFILADRDALRAQVERLTSAARKAVVALAHVSDAMPQYNDDYEALSAALAETEPKP